jgi:hypothetical protein
MENIVFCCQECVFIGPLRSSGCPVVERLCFGNMFIKPLPSNGHMHHNIITAFHLSVRLKVVVLSKVCILCHVAVFCIMRCFVENR